MYQGTKPFFHLVDIEFRVLPRKLEDMKRQISTIPKAVEESSNEIENLIATPPKTVYLRL